VTTATLPTRSDRRAQITSLRSRSKAWSSAEPVAIPDGKTLMHGGCPGAGAATSRIGTRVEVWGVELAMPVPRMMTLQEVTE